jgi:hypothetical protein
MSTNLSASVYCVVAALLAYANYCDAWSPNASPASSSDFLQSHNTPRLNTRPLSSNLPLLTSSSVASADAATNSYLFSDFKQGSSLSQRPRQGRQHESQGTTASLQQGGRAKSASIGTKLHLANAALSTAVAIICVEAGRRAAAYSVLSSFCMQVTFCGLIYDNMLSALGVYAGEGKLLQRLCKGRYLSHAVSMPFLSIVITEIGVFHGLFCKSLARVLIPALGVLTVYELLDWLSHDTSKWALYDSRGLMEHPPQMLAGTMKYTSANVLKCVLPAVLMSLYAFTTGLALFGSVSGKMLFSSGLISFVGCSLRKSDVQMVAELACMGLIWSAALFH